ncbi:DALR anticodon-binding domain-containing protein [Streptomonospora litoralis]|uniref:Arginyl-tRNA synthetase n=1 Tax=Streptomonospora litoralis TaxID=2498135 RepID=A0A4P6Q266_9ACTN|nr:DALR anticodon-binding domain-containing protein [Streptomonospora litoralis]QBI52844.1 arginyl-tRNA synthetase [Streptomonospora litoralis]
MAAHAAEAAGDWWLTEGATPARVDALLRAALAEAAECPLQRVPAAEPRRPPPPATAHYTTALPLRMAGALGRPASQLAEAAVARLLTRRGVAGARVERGGFIAVDAAPQARAAMVATAAADGTGFLCGYLRYAGRLGATTAATGAAVGAESAEEAAIGAPGRAPGSRLSALDAAATVEEARHLAREDARRRMRDAAEPAEPAADAREPAAAPARTDGSADGGAGGASDPGRPHADSSGASSAAAARGEPWRDPWMDRGGGETPAARLLAAVGEASARVAFCRSASERPRPGEVTGPGLPAVPTAEFPGAWALGIGANPAFAVRYAHAHAASTLRWVREAQGAAAWVPAHTPPAHSAPRSTGAGPAPVPAAGAPRPRAALLAPPDAAALAGTLFDGPLLLHAAVRRSEPHMLVRYLEGVAAAYHEWRESGGFTAETTGEPGGGASASATDRLLLCAAAAGVLHAGLSLLGVSAPTRL